MSVWRKNRAPYGLGKVEFADEGWQRLFAFDTGDNYCARLGNREVGSIFIEGFHHGGAGGVVQIWAFGGGGGFIKFCLAEVSFGTSS